MRIYDELDDYNMSGACSKIAEDYLVLGIRAKFHWFCNYPKMPLEKAFDPMSTCATLCQGNMWV